MTRVSLKEAYDNKDVVAQIYAIRDIAEGAEDTADSAVTTANTASAHVDELVPQVEGAVTNANNASASAQASAQTVAGYENRLSAVEGEVSGLDSDLGAVELRVTTAEGQIVTIQGRVTALETADGQNVKLTGTQTIGGVKHFADSPTAPTTTTGLWDIQVANGAKVKNELDNYSPMVRTSDNQTIAGNKTFSRTIIGYAGGKPLGACGPNGNASGNTYLMAKIDSLPNNEGGVFHIMAGLNNANYAYAEYRAFNASGTLVLQCIRKAYTGTSQKPKLYIYNNNGTIEIYGTSMSWCVPQLFFDYWENGGLMYSDLTRHTMTVSTDFSTVTLPTGAIAESGLLIET